MLRWLQMVMLSGLLAASGLARPEDAANFDAVADLKKTLTQLEDELQRIRLVVKELSGISKTGRQGSKIQSLSTSLAKASALSNLIAAQEAYQRGVAAEERRQYDQAVEPFTKAIQLDPASDSAFLHRARAYFELGNFNLALSDLNASLAVQPNNSRAYELRARVNRSLKAYDRAIADWREAARRDPDNQAMYLLSEAGVEDDRGDLSKALELYGRALVLNPRMPGIYLKRAAALKKQNHLDQAIQDCTAALELDSSDANGYVCRADCYIRLDRLPLAITDLDRAIRLNPTVPDAAPLISAVWQRLEVNAEAQQLNVALAPRKPDAPLRAASAGGEAPQSPSGAVPSLSGELPGSPAATSAVQGEPAPAPVAAAKGVDAEPGGNWPADPLLLSQQMRTYTAAGRAYTSQGRYAEAIQVLSKAIDLGPTFALAYNSRGYAYLKSGQYEPAIADFSLAIQLNSGYGNAYWNRSAARRLMGDRQGAKDDWQRAAVLAR